MRVLHSSRMTNNAAILVFFQNMLLCLYQSGKKLETPGGQVNKGERSKDGAIRELFEETNLRVKSSKVRKVVTRNHRNGSKTKIYTVNLNQIPYIKISHEHSGYAWYTVQHVIKNTHNFKWYVRNTLQTPEVQTLLLSKIK